jgi:hypothetical protein
VRSRSHGRSNEKKNKKIVCLFFFFFFFFAFRYECVIPMGAHTYWLVRESVEYMAFQCTELGLRSVEELERWIDENDTLHYVIKTVPDMDIPRLLRGLLGNKPLEFVDTHSRAAKFTAEGPFSSRFVSCPPVYPNKIDVRGRVWLEPIDDDQCRQVMEGECHVNVFGGSVIQKIIMSNLDKSYKSLPELVAKFRKLMESRGRDLSRVAPASPVRAGGAVDSSATTDKQPGSPSHSPALRAKPHHSRGSSRGGGMKRGDIAPNALLETTPEGDGGGGGGEGEGRAGGDDSASAVVVAGTESGAGARGDAARSDAAPSPAMGHDDTFTCDSFYSAVDGGDSMPWFLDDLGEDGAIDGLDALVDEPQMAHGPAGLALLHKASGGNLLSIRMRSGSISSDDAAAAAVDNGHGRGSPAPKSPRVVGVSGGGGDGDSGINSPDRSARPAAHPSRAASAAADLGSDQFATPRTPPPPPQSTQNQRHRRHNSQSLRVRHRRNTSRVIVDVPSSPSAAPDAAAAGARVPVDGHQDRQYYRLEEIKRTSSEPVSPRRNATAPAAPTTVGSATARPPPVPWWRRIMVCCPPRGPRPQTVPRRKRNVMSTAMI